MRKETRNVTLLWQEPAPAPSLQKQPADRAAGPASSRPFPADGSAATQHRAPSPAAPCPHAPGDSAASEAAAPGHTAGDAGRAAADLRPWLFRY